MEAAVITVGTFDGVHLGHQAILGKVKAIAEERALPAIAYTFPFPPRFASPGPHLILTERMKAALLRRYVTRIVPGEFHKVRDLSPQEFVKRVLIDALGACTVVVGKNFRFGSGRSGDAALLKELGEAYGLELFIVPPVTVDGMPVSSTRIRALIREGRVEEAGNLLGRPPIVTGKVVPGDRLGRRLGYPTANLRLPPTLIRPGSGIYLGYAFWETGEGPGLLYVGNRPTVDGKKLRIELHLLSPPPHELAAERMEVHLLARMRDDRIFSSLSALKEQIASDTASAQRLLTTHPRPEPILFG